MKINITETGVCGVSLAADSFLAVIKFIGGAVSHSASLTSDAVHSCADSLTSLITLLGTLPRKDAAKKKRAENLVLRFICSVLFATGVAMLIRSVISAFNGSAAISAPGYASLVSLFSLCAKAAMFFFSKRESKKLGSAILYAQAYHHRSDALSCIGSFTGVIGSAMGLPLIDGLAGTIISLMIIKSSFDIYFKN